jgi:hypothetical protein
MFSSLVTLLRYIKTTAQISEVLNRPYGIFQYMQDKYEFSPPRRFGLIFHLVSILLLFLAGSFGLWRATRASIGPLFLLFIFLSLLSFLIILFLVYRAYTLRNANYTLMRDGIQLRWGLRYEDIPITAIDWVHPATELETRLPYPRFRWPGALLGTLRFSEDVKIEFLASSSRNLVLIATSERLYAISPADLNTFLYTFQRCTELGSITPLKARSIYPAIYLRLVWSTLPVKLLILNGVIFSSALLVLISLATPKLTLMLTTSKIDVAPWGGISSTQLLLLPVFNAIIFLTNLLLGLYFFRHQESQPLAYLLWGSGVLTPLLLSISVIILLQSM